MIMDTVSSAPYWRRQFESDGPDPDMFTDMSGGLDPMFYGSGDALGHAVKFVGLYETADLQAFVQRSVCDVLAFRYFGELSQSLVRTECPYGDERLKALYWAAVGIALAQLFRYVERYRAYERTIVFVGG